jgi:hypothetical protein
MQPTGFLVRAFGAWADGWWLHAAHPGFAAGVEGDIVRFSRASGVALMRALAVFIWLMPAFSSAHTFYVTNTRDDYDEGSFRWAVGMCDWYPILPDTVLFAIPMTDPGYDPQTGVWTITYDVAGTTGDLYTFRKPHAVVDGFSQREYIGIDTNPYGPEIEIKGPLEQGYTQQTGIVVLADDITIRGLCINRFPWGCLSFWGDPDEPHIENMSVVGCYLGTDPTGSIVPAYCGEGLGAARVIGLSIGGDSPEDGCVIVGLLNDVAVSSCGNVSIVNNHIGTDRTGTVDLTSANDPFCSITIGGRVGPILIRDNLIGGGYRHHNIWITSAGSDSGATVTILRDQIGVGLDGSPMGAQTFGILINGTPGHLIRETTIAHTHHPAIYVIGDAADHITISRNSIYGCRGGIQLSQETYEHQSAYGVDYIDGEYGPGPNEEIDPCRCDSIANSATGASGTTEVYFTCMRDCTVEVFIVDRSGSHAPCPEAQYGLVYSGMTYLGDAEEISQGPVFSTYRLAVSPALPFGTGLTATATNRNGSTSEFWCSCTVSLAGETSEGCDARPARLLSVSPNPAVGAVTLQYRVIAPGTVGLHAYDLAGALVAEVAGGHAEPGEYVASWDLTDDDGAPIPAGVYVVRLSARGFVDTIELVVSR